MTLREWKLTSTRYNGECIPIVSPGQICHVNLKSWGDGYFRSLNLPIGNIYVVVCNYTGWSNRRHDRIDLYCPLFDQRFEWNATAVRMYSMSLVLLPEMVLVDSSFCRQYPKILE